jgi:hypothetical protein
MVEHQTIYSPGRKKQLLHNEYYESLPVRNPAIDSNNLLTLLATNPPSSCPEWVLLHFSCFPHPCWVPTDSFPRSKADQAPHPPLSIDRFQDALDPGNCRFFVGLRYPKKF